jgi:uncharacterized protein YcnI
MGGFSSRKRSRIPTRAAVLSAVATLAFGATAYGHVEVKPKRVSAGETTTLRIGIENESANARTVKVDIRMTAGFEQVEPKPAKGWRFKLRRAGAQITRMTITATSAAAGISRGGTIRTFAFRAKVPDRAGTISFKTLQTYDNGDVVRWIGPPGTAEPAATLKVEAAAQPSNESGQTTTAPESASPASPDDSSSDDGGLSGAAIVAIVVGGLVVLGGTFAALRSRERRS